MTVNNYFIYDMEITFILKLFSVSKMHDSIYFLKYTILDSTISSGNWLETGKFHDAII